MKMFIQSWRENITEDFYNMLLLLLFAGIATVITTMTLQGSGSLGSLQNIYQGSSLY